MIVVKTANTYTLTVTSNSKAVIGIKKSPSQKAGEVHIM